jgi:nucleoside-diphosphate-sugar epimerase
LTVAATAPHPSGEVFLLAGRDVVSTRAMVAAVARALGRTPPRLRAPMLPFLALATASEWILRPLGIQPPLHRRRLDFFRKSFSLSAEKAKRLLGFESDIGFDEGALLTARWYEERGLLN